MRLRSMAVLAALLAVSAAAAPGDTATFSMAGAEVSFVMPSGFTELTKEEMAIKFPRQSGPGRAFGNERRTVTIGGGLTQQALPIEQLPAAERGMGDQMSRIMPALEWIKREVVTINGRKWIYFSMITPAPDSKIRNEMYVTSVEGKAFIINVNATVGEFGKYENAIGEIRNSLRVSADGRARNPIKVN